GRAGGCGAASWRRRVRPGRSGPGGQEPGGCSSGGLLGLVGDAGAAAGQGEEDVVEVGGVHGQFDGLDVGGVEPVEDGAQFALAAAAGDLQGEGLVVPGGLAQGGGGAPVRARVGEAEPYVSAGDQPLQLLGGALGGDPAVVEHGDAVGELVGLLQVLGGE